MELKKLHLGTMSFAVDSMDEVALQLATALAPITSGLSGCSARRSKLILVRYRAKYCAGRSSCVFSFANRSFSSYSRAP